MLKRLTRSIFVSAVVTCGVFWVMQYLVASGRAAISDEKSRAVVEFVRLKRNSELNLKERRLPEKAKPKKQPRQPSLDVSQNNVVSDMPPMKISAPKLTGNFKLQGGLHLGVGGSSDRQTVPVVRVRPMYPPRAAQRRIEGWVEVGFEISPTGSVREAHVIRSEPARIFDRAALRAIRKWKYRPQVQDGVAVTSTETVRLKFELGEG